MKEHIKRQEQKNINAKGFEEKVSITPSGYHSDRARNVIFGTKESVMEGGRNLGILPATPSFKKMVEMFGVDQASPAGGWYLVKEQRDWLKNHLKTTLTQLASRKPQRKIKILEAGVASYLHHFSYLSIIKNALEELGDLIPGVILTVTDKGYFPLFCIEAVNRNSLERLKKDGHGFVFDYKVDYSDNFFSFLQEEELLEYEKIEVRIRQYDLTDFENTGELGRFDLITEHFITAVIDNFELVRQIRNTYGRLLTKGGYLLCASGITPHVNPQRYDDFIDIHEEVGLELTSRVNVWDPYGMRTSNLMKILEDQEVEAPYDNGLFEFKKL